MRLHVAALLLALALAGCQQPPRQDPPLDLPSVPCDGESSVVVGARAYWNFTWIVNASVAVRCADEVVQGAHVEARMPDGAVKEIVTGADGTGTTVAYHEDDPSGQSVRFRIVVNGSSAAYSAEIKRPAPP